MVYTWFMRRKLPKRQRIYRLKRELVFAIVEARWEQGLTQAKLAAKLRRSQSFVAKSERIFWNPRLDALIELIDALGLELYVKYQE